MIAVAVFDVAKYFIEEEVIRGQEMRIASVARQPHQVHLDEATRRDGVRVSSRRRKPLLTAILIVVGLGLYQRLSAAIEQKDEKR